MARHAACLDLPQFIQRHLQVAGLDRRPQSHGRLVYRRVENTGRVNGSQFASGLTAPVSYEGARVSHERIGYSLDANAWSLGGARAGIAYDLYNARVANAYASLDGYVSSRVTISADYDYVQPTFDGDSIFNFFPAEPMNDLGLRANVDASHGLYASQRLLLALVESGLGRDDAYRRVQRHAMRAWDDALDFEALVRADADIAQRIDLDEVFTLEPYVVHVDTVFGRLRALRATHPAAVHA